MNELPNIIKSLYPMECPKCSHVLTVFEYEASMIYVDPLGIPRKNTNSKYNIIGVCPHCGYSTDLIKIADCFARDTKYFRDIKKTVDKWEEKRINL